MPRRDDIESILLIGSGPIVIGQACEFDYSGTQAVKVLRQEGCRVILVNSNPATIMTDPDMADAVYIEPIDWRTVARIIEKERPDALLPLAAAVAKGPIGDVPVLAAGLGLATLGEVLEFASSAVGTAKAGGTRWGSVGAVAGCIVGAVAAV